MTPTLSDSRRGVALVAVAAVLWALIGLFTPALLDEGLDPVEIGFWRALLGGCAFGVHALATGRAAVASGRDRAALAAFGVVAVGLFYVALARAIDLGGVSLAWILLYTAPAWVALAATLVLRERVDRVRVGLVAVTAAGVVLVATGGGSGVTISAAAVVWGLVAGWSYATWYVAGKRLLDRYDPVTIAAWTLLAGAAVTAPLALPSSPSPHGFVLLGGLAVASTYLPVLAYYTGLARIDASRAAIIATIEPVVALGFAAAVQGERLGAPALVGAAAVVVAAAVASARR